MPRPKKNITPKVKKEPKKAKQLPPVEAPKVELPPVEEPKKSNLLTKFVDWLLG